MLTSKQRAQLRSLAANEPTIMQVGKSGVTEAMVKTVSDALEARELVKVKVLETAFMSAREACEIVCEEINCEPVSCVGSKFVVYKESRENKKIEL